MTDAAVDPVALTQDLIRRASITPVDAGAMDLVEQALRRLGFACRRLPFGDVQNLYARRGSSGPNLCFAGHVDVVPPGDVMAWRWPPFDAVLEDGVLHGRGAADMKGGIAAWIAALSQVLSEGEPAGSLSLLITGDEEGVALDGTKKVVRLLQSEGERIDHCVVGEPSGARELGDTIKVGRRGSLNAWITVEGRQGHVAYPDRAANPIRALVSLLERLQARRLDDGFPEFPPSNLEITTVDVANPASNVIPARAAARLNIRFNPNWRGCELIEWLQEECAAAERRFGGGVTLEPLLSGEAFLTEPGPFLDLVTHAVEQTLGRTPEHSTSGGTSDARFIRDLCPVIELGLVGATIHQIDERTAVEDIHALTRVYGALIRGYFEAHP